jgi:hypothetical protein
VGKGCEKNGWRGILIGDLIQRRVPKSGGIGILGCDGSSLSGRKRGSGFVFRCRGKCDVARKSLMRWILSICGRLVHWCNAGFKRGQIAKCRPMHERCRPAYQSASVIGANQRDFDSPKHAHWSSKSNLLPDRQIPRISKQSTFIPQHQLNTAN